MSGDLHRFEARFSDGSNWFFWADDAPRARESAAKCAEGLGERVEIVRAAGSQRVTQAPPFRIYRATFANRQRRTFLATDAADAIAAAEGYLAKHRLEGRVDGVELVVDGPTFDSFESLRDYVWV